MRRVWYAPGREELFPEDQWYNKSDEAHAEQADTVGEEEGEEEEARVEREMQEDFLHRGDDYGAPGEEEEAQ